MNSNYELGCDLPNVVTLVMESFTPKFLGLNDDFIIEHVNNPKAINQ